MSAAPHDPLAVIPELLAEAIADHDRWFVIGGQAVRCLLPYRPSQDTDFGVASAEDLDALVAHLQAKGEVEIDERGEETVHLRYNGVKVSIFVLDALVAHTVGRRLTTTGILATKLHAILDRGTRRDFFDLYVTLQRHRLGILECLRAMREVYQEPIREGLLLRALTYFDDAEREAPLPGEGDGDWAAVRRFFLARVGELIAPPTLELEIQANVIDLRD